MGKSTRRFSDAARAVLAVGLALAAGTAAAPSASAATAVSTTPQSEQAAQWLAQQLDDGLTSRAAGRAIADVVLALAATGTQHGAAEAATDWLEANLSAEAGGYDDG